ncbi:unnamed protein product [Larinioides sclopetarius]|uniref:Uncharacterized protein n=1 Tax=Larinioides sclopetarius TaxID=280406 RepID=A0AAV2BS59_9ARAC
MAVKIMATSPGTYPVSRENPPIPYLPSTELEPPVDQATSVWNISMAAKFLGLLWHWWWLSVCRARFSLRISIDRQHVAPTLLPLTIGVSEKWNHHGRGKSRFYSPIDRPLFSESSLLLRRTGEGHYMLLHSQELLDIHGFHKPAIVQTRLDKLHETSAAPFQSFGVLL